MKKLWAVLCILCLSVSLLTGCGSSTAVDLTKDLTMHNSTFAQFSLTQSINTMLSHNANLLAGSFKKDGEDFKTIQKDVPKMINDSIDVVKRMTVKTAEGKTLKTALQEYLEHEKKLFEQNVAAVKSGSASDKQKAMDTSVKTPDVQKKYNDALAAVNTAITEKSKPKK
jgi:hypothetical protein